MISGRIISKATGETILQHVEKAETTYERCKGLLGRNPLEEGHGLLLSPCNSIHTFFMKIPIDVVFLDRNNRVQALKKNLKPYRITMSLGARYVLELMAGQLDLSSINLNDQLVWEAKE